MAAIYRLSCGCSAKRLECNSFRRTARRRTSDFTAEHAEERREFKRPGNVAIPLRTPVSSAVKPCHAGHSMQTTSVTRPPPGTMISKPMASAAPVHRIVRHGRSASPTIGPAVAVHHLTRKACSQRSEWRALNYTLRVIWARRGKNMGEMMVFPNITRRGCFGINTPEGINLNELVVGCEVQACAR